MASEHEVLRAALRSAAAALKADGPRFALAGGYALWAYGAPEPVHDVDFVVAESDVETAAATLEAAGFTIVRPPEDWLFKACVEADCNTFVDVLHRLNGVPVTPSSIDDCEALDVLAVSMPVLSPTSVMTQRLLALHEHHCDFAALLPAARAVRERVDWQAVRKICDGNAFAASFLMLTDELGITPD